MGKEWPPKLFEFEVEVEVEMELAMFAEEEGIMAVVLGELVMLKVSEVSMREKMSLPFVFEGVAENYAVVTRNLIFVKGGNFAVEVHHSLSPDDSLLSKKRCLRTQGVTVVVMVVVVENYYLFVRK